MPDTLEPQTAAVLTFFNDTPLTLKVSLQRAGNGASVPPLGSTRLTCPLDDSGTVSDQASGRLLRKLTVVQSVDVGIDADDLQPGELGAASAATYVNRTDRMIELRRVVEQPETDHPAPLKRGERKGTSLRDGSPVVIGTERFGRLGPGEQGQYTLREGEPVLVRTLTTQELLAAHFHAASKQKIEIDDDFLEDRREQSRPKPDPRFGTLQLVKEETKNEPPDSVLYQCVSEHKLLMLSQFNTRPNVIPRRVRLSAPVLLWDHHNDPGQIMRFSGEDVGDLKELEMYADRVIIRSPLHFPGTTVTIYARQLEFQRDGAIKTDPLPFRTKALSPFKIEGHPAGPKLDKDSKPVVDADGKPVLEPTYKAADGLHGEDAGDIHLFVRDVVQDTPAERFTCCGSNGQEAEPGGLKLYAPPAGKSEYPAAEKGPDLTPVTAKDIKEFMADKARYPVDNGAEEWRWPGEASLPEKAEIRYDALNQGQVVHVAISAIDDRVWAPNESVGFLPSHDHQVLAASVWVKPGFNRDGDIGFANGRTDPKRLRPGNGRSAYPSGLPGDGGSGGTVTSHMAGASVAELCATRRGESPESSRVDGDPPGTPFPAYWLLVRVIYRSSVKSASTPTHILEKVSADPGANAPARRGAPGSSAGGVKDGSETGLAWMSPKKPLGVAAVVAYARDVYRNGNRDEARAVLEPYHAAFMLEEEAGGALSAALTGLYAEIVAMRTNMANNLDYYGHPVGWLPRLDLTTTFTAWREEKQSASQLLYYATNLVEDWQKLSDQREVLADASDALHAETDRAIKLLEKSYEDVKTARATLDAVTKQFLVQERAIEAMRNMVRGDAETMIAEQRLFSGFAKIASGIMQSVPVGQPYLGLAGKTVGIVGDIDWTKPNPMEGVSKGIAEFGKTAGDFITENRDRISKDASRTLTKKLTEAKNSIDTLEKSVTKKQGEVDKVWETKRSEQTRLLEEKIKTANRELAKQENQDKKDDLQKRISELTDQKDALKTESMTLARDRLQQELSESQQDDKEEHDKAEAQRKEALLKAISELQDKKTDLTTKVESIGKDLTNRETATGNFLTSLKGVGDGAASIAQGIMVLSAPYDEAEVNRITEELLGKSKYKDEYRKKLGELQALGAQKNGALAALAGCSQQIADCTALISRNTAELIALSDQKQAADGALDAGVLQYLNGIQKRANDRIRWYQYNFLKAYEYEMLREPGNDFMNLDNWVRRLRQAKLNNDIAAKKISAAKAKEVVVDEIRLSESDFSKAEELVMTDQLQEMAKFIVAQRVQFGKSDSPFTISLPKEMRDELLAKGKVKFLLPDLGIGSFKEYYGKIASLTLDKLTLEVKGKQAEYERVLGSLSSTTSPREDDDEACDAMDGVSNTVVLDLQFEHSGISIIRDRSGNNFFFRNAPTDAAISWGFTYSGAASTGNRLRPDTASSKEDPAFSKAQITYREYYPSLFGEVTLWINKKAHEEGKLAAILAPIQSIRRVKLSVTLARARN